MRVHQHDADAHLIELHESTLVPCNFAELVHPSHMLESVSSHRLLYRSRMLSASSSPDWATCKPAPARQPKSKQAPLHRRADDRRPHLNLCINAVLGVLLGGCPRHDLRLPAEPLLHAPHHHRHALAPHLLEHPAPGRDHWSAQHGCQADVGVCRRRAAHLAPTTAALVPSIVGKGRAVSVAQGGAQAVFISTRSCAMQSSRHGMAVILFQLSECNISPDILIFIQELAGLYLTCIAR